MSRRLRAVATLVVALTHLAATHGLALAGDPAQGATKPKSPTKSPPSKSASPDAEYKRHMQTGIKLFQESDYDAALAEFEIAYQLKPNSSPLINAALCHKNLRQYTKAVRELERALSAHSTSMSEADRKAVEAAIEELRGLLGYVRIEVEPTNATVLVDGEELPAGAARALVPLAPGTRTISAKAPGHMPAEQTVKVTSGSRDQIVSLKLTPELGWLVVRTPKPGTRIVVDGLPRGSSRFVGQAPAGRHTVEIVSAEGRRTIAVVDVVATRTTEVRTDSAGQPVVTAGLPTPVTGPVLEPLPADTPKPAPPREMRGFYALGAGTLLVPLRNSAGSAGAAVGVRGGYRLNNLTGVEMMFDYNIVPTRADELKSTRLGLNLRLMTDGPQTRFVGVLGAGLAYDSISNAKAASVFGNLELGLEMNLGKMLGGVFVQSTLASAAAVGKVLTDEFNAGLGAAGLGVRFGYGQW